MSHVQAFVALAIGVAGAFAAGFVIRQNQAVFGAASDAVLAPALGLFALNVMGFAFNALAPIVAFLPSGGLLVERLAPSYALFDLQASVVTLALIWLMLL